MKKKLHLFTQDYETTLNRLNDNVQEHNLLQDLWNEITDNQIPEDIALVNVNKVATDVNKLKQQVDAQFSDNNINNTTHNPIAMNVTNQNSNQECNNIEEILTKALNNIMQKMNNNNQQSTTKTKR